MTVGHIFRKILNKKIETRMRTQLKENYIRFW
nr:MAG TPA: Gem-associated protein [Caudoviricetes sp.]